MLCFKLFSFSFRNDHLLVHKRSQHPDQYVDNFTVSKKPHQTATVPAKDLSSSVTVASESSGVESGSSMQQLTTVQQSLPAAVPSISPPSISPPLLPKNLSTNNRYEVIPEEELQNASVLYRQSYQPQLHQPQFPYPQMISAQAFLQGAMSHLAQQQQQHQSHMSSQHPQFSSNDRHTKTNQYIP